mgnify:CR=1 FL=1|jgi:hypothetical protein
MIVEGTPEYELMQKILEVTQDENTEYANGIADFCSWMLGELPDDDFEFNVYVEDYNV